MSFHKHGLIVSLSPRIDHAVLWTSHHIVRHECTITLVLVPCTAPWPIQFGFRFCSGSEGYIVSLSPRASHPLCAIDQCIKHFCWFERSSQHWHACSVAAPVRNCMCAVDFTEGMWRTKIHRCRLTGRMFSTTSPYSIASRIPPGRVKGRGAKEEVS